MKSGHPTPSDPSNHHLKLIFFSSPTDCVWGGGGERKRVGAERERERERERTSLSQSVRVFFSSLILFHVMGFALRRRNGTIHIFTTIIILAVFSVP